LVATHPPGAYPGREEQTMDRTEAHEFLKSYIKFMHTASEYVKIVDVDPACEEVEIKVWNTRGESSQRWVGLWAAAKVIEANSCQEVTDA